MSNSSKVKNLPAAIYPLDDIRELHWRRQKLGISNTWRSIWVKDNTFNKLFTLNSDIVTIINFRNKNSLYSKYFDDKLQYQHDSVKITGENFSIGLVFRVVNSKERYNLKDNNMIVVGEIGESDMINGCYSGPYPTRGSPYIRPIFFSLLSFSHRTLEYYKIVMIFLLLLLSPFLVFSCSDT